jgi:hypothetical protein
VWIGLVAVGWAAVVLVGVGGAEVTVGVAVDGNDVSVGGTGVSVGVSVGGTGVSVGVTVGGSGVSVGVGGTGVTVSVSVGVGGIGVTVGVAVGGSGVSVGVGGTGVTVGVAVGATYGSKPIRSRRVSPSLPLMMSSCCPAVRANTLGLNSLLSSVPLPRQEAKRFSNPTVRGMSHIIIGVVGSPSIFI